MNPPGRKWIILTYYMLVLFTVSACIMSGIIASFIYKTKKSHRMMSQQLSKPTPDEFSTWDNGIHPQGAHPYKEAPWSKGKDSASLATSFRFSLTRGIIPTYRESLAISNPSLVKALDHFHGTDWTGHNGIYAKSGFDLLLLFEDYISYSKGALSFEHLLNNRHLWSISKNGIVVDVFFHTPESSESMEYLNKVLVSHYTFGGVTTGVLPLDKILLVSELPEISFIRPALLLSSK